MTHSIFTNLIVIVFAALFAAAILWGEHYHPWGVELDQRLNYVLGTVGMLIPYTVLMLFWTVEPPTGCFISWALGGLWVIVGVSGLTVYTLYEYDAKRNMHQRAIAAETAERAGRSEPA